MKRLFLLTITTLLLSNALFAQSNYEVRLGTAIPLHDFSDMVTAGVDVGFKYQYTFKVKGLSAFASVDALWNIQNSDTKDNYKSMRESLAYSYDLDGKNYIETYNDPTYFNIPILVGVNYCFNFSDKIGVWAEAGIGYNLEIRTKLYYLGETQTEKAIREDWHHYKYTEKYKPASAFAYMTGIGMKFKKYTLGIRYIGIGKHGMNYYRYEEYKKYYNSNKGSFKEAKTLNVDKYSSGALNISLGVCF